MLLRVLSLLDASSVSMSGTTKGKHFFVCVVLLRGNEIGIGAAASWTTKFLERYEKMYRKRSITADNRRTKRIQKKCLMRRNHIVLPFARCVFVQVGRLIK